MMPWVLTLPWDAISREAKQFGLDKCLVGAIVMRESSGRIDAIRFEPNYRWFFDLEKCSAREGTSITVEKNGQATSYGYMQVMGAVARELAFEGSFGALLSQRSLHFGCRHLQSLIARYGDTNAAIASYNAGSPRRIGDAYENQSYVDAVLNFKAQLK